ncbi:hypothetical protein V7x_00970 [Crateriforma conspicua]|uniref:Uncharacterized protein n=1 Tax=Crateriforma conspicua TaxID=2527996 RepID=A0A5C6FTN7_9PLAN|nr:hypothetical protein V7x_00970 [Crateriforma conspicua]
MLTKTKPSAFSPNKRLTEISALLADSIIALNAQGLLSATNSESLSEVPEDSLDLSAKPGLCVDTRATSASRKSNQGVQHGA